MAAHRPVTCLRWTLALWLAAGSFAVAHAGAPQAKDAARALYLKEKAVCVEGRSNQDRATCLKEADNAYDEARRRPSSTPDAATLERNAVERCARVKAEDRLDCRRLALGQGKNSGSVEGGGVIKQITTVEPTSPITPR